MIKYTKREQVRAYREAGLVKRCHTHPIVGEYNVAMHCYGIACLIKLFEQGERRDRMIRYALSHDIEERWTGDIPYPAKMLNPYMTKEVNALENYIRQVVGVTDFLSAEEAELFKVYDMLELWLWAGEQESMGNTYAQPIFHAAENVLIKLATAPIHIFMDEYQFIRGNDFLTEHAIFDLDRD